MSNSQSDDTYSEAETVARREAALKRAFATPHKPHKPKRSPAEQTYVVLDGRMLIADVHLDDGRSMVADLYLNKESKEAGTPLERRVELER